MAAGRRVLDPELVAAALAAGPSPLTPRETEVLTLLTTGRINQQIAESLGISQGTANVHAERIIRKLEVSDRTQAAVRAIELGFSSP